MHANAVSPAQSSVKPKSLARFFESPAVSYVLFNLIALFYLGQDLRGSGFCHWANERLIFNDIGASFLVLDRLLEGKRLFVDVFYHYGPLSLFANWVAAKLFGHTPFVFLAASFPLMLVSLNLGLAILRRHLQKGAALLVALFVFMPSIKPLMGNSMQYTPTNLVLLLVAVLLIKPFPQRSRKCGFALGAVFGAMQLNKFGFAIFAWATLFLLDLFVFWSEKPSRKAAIELLRSHLQIAAVCLSIELAYCAYAFLTLPSPIAKDVIWPAYHLQGYSQTIHKGNRFPRFELLPRFGFFYEQLPYCIGIGFSLFLLGHFAWTCLRRKQGALPSSSMPGAYMAALFFLACLFYWKHQWLILENSWMLLWPIALSFPLLGRRVLAAVILMLLPFATVPFRQVQHQSIAPAPGDCAAMSMPNGQSLYFDKAWTPRMARLVDFTTSLRAAYRSRCGREPVFVITQMIPIGLSHWMCLQTLSRHTFWFPAFWRPYELPGMFKDFTERTDFLLVTDKEAFRGEGSDFFKNPSIPETINPFGPAYESEFRKKLLSPLIVEPGCVIFPIAGLPARTEALSEAAPLAAPSKGDK